MTTHKQKLLKDSLMIGNYKGIFDHWTKANGHIRYNIEGHHKDFLDARGVWKRTTFIKYDFCDETLGRYVLTTSGSLYRLEKHLTKGTPEEFSIAQEKASDMITFRVLNGPCPRRPVS